jgi:Flp pilus assembly protein TadD
MLSGLLKNLIRDTIRSTRHWAQKKRATYGGATDSSAAMAKREAECRRTLKLMPNFAEAHNNLGVVLKDTKRLVQAEAAFRSALNLEGKNVVALYNLGIVLAETNRPWEAEVVFRSALELLPNFVEAHNNLGIILMATGRLADAESAFRRALELKPSYSDAEKNLSIVLAKSKHFAGAEADYRQRIALTPDSADAYINLGVVLKNAKRLSEAEAAFRQAIVLQGNNVVALYNLGVVLAETNRPWDAGLAYKSALSLQPSFVEAHNNLGLALLATKRPAEAEVAYRNALKLQPDHVDAHNNLGVVFMDTKRLQEAERAFRHVLILKPDHEQARRSLDFVLKEIKRLSDTEATRRRAIGLEPDCAMSHYRLGLTLLQLGKWDEAVGCFQQVLAIEPNNADAHNNLGVAFMRQMRIDESVECFLQANAIAPGFAEIMANLGAAYIRKGELLLAEQWSKAALAIEPQQVQANQNMAQLLSETGHGEEAKRHLEQASSGQAIRIEYGTNAKRTVLLLWTKRAGNVPSIEFLLPTTVNTRVNWEIESARDDQTENLPDHDLVFNAMGDPDLIGDAVGPLNRFAADCTKPLLNRPDKVARTARNNLPALFGGIDNIVVPAVWRFAQGNEWDESVVDQLPLIIRPVDSHGGTGLELARTAAELAHFRSLQRSPVYVTRLVDFRSADSWFRKYRVIYVDRKPYPYHLAIAKHWIVHYLSAEMEPWPWKLEEEKEFLQHPEAVLGRSAMEAIEAIGARMDLEYAGIDFSITADRRILVFETNPTMWIHAESTSGAVGHKNEYVFRIQDYFEQMLKRICN